MAQDTTIAFRISPATPADVPTIWRFIHALAQYERLAHLMTATEAGFHDALFGPRPVIEAAISWADEVPVGCIVFYETYSTFVGRRGVHVEDVYVEPSCRGRGYGRQMLVYVAKIAYERGCGRLEWAVLNWNFPAIRFYESLGAKSLEDWTTYRLTAPGIASLANNPETHKK
jgi:GNAT superfamily N-acetyltransferase